MNDLEVKVVDCAGLISFIKRIGRSGCAKRTVINKIIAEVELRGESLSTFSARNARNVRRNNLERFYESLVPAIEQARKEGKQTVYAITQELRRLKLKSFLGREFREPQVKSILEWMQQRDQRNSP